MTAWGGQVRWVGRPMRQWNDAGRCEARIAVTDHCHVDVTLTGPRLVAAVACADNVAVAEVVEERLP